MAAGSGETISRPPPPPTPPPYPFLRAPVRGHGEPTRARARARTQTLLTFGGAFSNHLAAAAAAGAARVDSASFRGGWDCGFEGAGVQLDKVALAPLVRPS